MNKINPGIALARNHARKLLKKTQCKKSPILLSKVIEFLKTDHDITFNKWDFSDSLSGVLITEGDVAGIAYNQNHHVHRQRFSVAHEIGHFIMNHPIRTPDFNLSSNDEHELEANQFAAELLMPLEFLKIDFKNGLVDISELSEKYWVSKEAMGWRIQDPLVLRNII